MRGCPPGLPPTPPPSHPMVLPFPPPPPSLTSTPIPSLTSTPISYAPSSSSVSPLLPSSPTGPPAPDPRALQDVIAFLHEQKCKLKVRPPLHLPPHLGTHGGPAPRNPPTHPSNPRPWSQIPHHRVGPSKTPRDTLPSSDSMVPGHATPPPPEGWRTGRPIPPTLVPEGSNSSAPPVVTAFPNSHTPIQPTKLSIPNRILETHPTPASPAPRPPPPDRSPLGVDRRWSPTS